jgi:hypothetical protein
MMQQAKQAEIDAAARAEDRKSLLLRLQVQPGVTGGGIVPPAAVGGF